MMLPILNCCLMYVVMFLFYDDYKNIGKDHDMSSFSILDMLPPKIQWKYKSKYKNIINKEFFI